jgi:hypothetical protein
MKKLVYAITLGGFGLALAACTPERTLDGGLGAVSGAIVGGPIGLVAGGVVGATAGPAIASSWGIRGSSHRRHSHKHRQT